MPNANSSNIRTLVQARHWIGTITESNWTPCLAPGTIYCKGQLELGAGGFRHWQLVVSFATKKTLRQCKQSFPDANGHWEPTRSNAADTYVWKEATRLGEQFEFGSKQLKRNSRLDWDEIRTRAIAGDFASIPGDVYVRYYGNLKAIRADNIQPIALERKCNVFWGPTSTGKSHRAWMESGHEAYSKDPRTKFWCGYSDQPHVVIDEFRGAIDVAHLLRWIDKYPVRVEVKGSSRPLMATSFWITSNLNPLDWYPDLDKDTTEALMRRLTITNITIRIYRLGSVPHATLKFF